MCGGKVERDGERNGLFNTFEHSMVTVCTDAECYS